MTDNISEPAKMPATSETGLLSRATKDPRIVAFLHWFKQPSNLLSVAAILAVVIVPWIERFLKSDEELRAKIDTLLAATDSVVSMNQQRATFSAGDTISTSVLTAKRANALARANAIAKPIRHDVYPAVLVALSAELCTSDDFHDAEVYLSEVLERGRGLRALADRPTIIEISSAHVVRAHCYVNQLQNNGLAKSPFVALADTEMAAAVHVLEGDSRDLEVGQRAISYADWANIDKVMREPAAELLHRRQAREVAQQMRVADPFVQAIVNPIPSVASTTPSASPLTEENAPRSAEGDTYMITYPHIPEEGAVAILPRYEKVVVDNNKDKLLGTLYLYRRGIFANAREVVAMNAVSNEFTRLTFQKLSSIEASPGTTSRSDLIWTIAHADAQGFDGIQMEVGKPPRRFIGKVSPGPTAAHKRVLQKSEQSGGGRGASPKRE